MSHSTHNRACGYTILVHTAKSSQIGRVMAVVYNSMMQRHGSNFVLIVCPTLERTMGIGAMQERLRLVASVKPSLATIHQIRMVCIALTVLRNQSDYCPKIRPRKVRESKRSVCAVTNL